jgi:hypothetical protein
MSTEFASLLKQARPGITEQQAYANGKNYAIRLAMSDGMTVAEYDQWRAEYAGLALIVFLDGDGKASGCKSLPRAEAEEFVASRPYAVVVAWWGVVTATDPRYVTAELGARTFLVPAPADETEDRS